MSDERMVYFARCVAANGADMGAIKVGCSFDGARRLISVANSEPFDLKMIGMFPGEFFEEYTIQCWLRKERIGGEYFRTGGEASALAAKVAASGQNPLPMMMDEPEGNWLSWDEVLGCMQRHDISVAEIAAAAGATTKSYEGHLKHAAVPNRKFVAGLTVAVMRKGFPIHWRASFQPALRKAA